MAGLELGDQLVDGDVELGAVLARAGDDERRARLVDQDRVHLVHDREVVIALQHLREVRLHVVAQVVEAELVVGGVGHVGVVGRLLVALGHARHHHPDAEAERVIDHAHPLGVAAGEVVVDGDDVHAPPGQRVEIDRQGGDQRLALAGLHLGNVALVQEDAADELHVERAQAERAAGRLAGVGEGLRKQVVQRLALGEPRLELGGLGEDALVGERLVLGLERVDPLDGGPGRLDPAVVGGAEDLLRDRAQSQHQPVVLSCGRAPASHRRCRLGPPICHDGGACSPAPIGLSLREARSAFHQRQWDVSGWVAPVNGAPGYRRRSGIHAAPLCGARTGDRHAQHSDRRASGGHHPRGPGVGAGRAGGARLRRRDRARHRQRHRDHARPPDRGQRPAAAAVPRAA